MRKSTLLIPLSLVSLLALGCGGDNSRTSGTSGGTSGDLTLDELPAYAAQRQCQNATDCHRYESVADCEASVDVSVGSIKNAVDAGKVKYNADKVDACLDALQQAAACTYSDLFQNLGGSDIPSACQEVFVGTVAEKGSCVIDEECVSQNCVAPPTCMMQCCVGECAPAEAAPVLAKIGEPCVTTGCEAGAYCQEDAQSNPTTCAATLKKGDACSSFDSCTLPLYCAYDFMTGEGACAEHAAHGAACTPGDIYSCDPIDDYCDATTKVCTLRKLVGEACSDAASPCVNFAYCDPASKKCVKKGAPGDACDAMVDAQVCLDSANCDAGKCTNDPEVVCP